MPASAGPEGMPSNNNYQPPALPRFEVPPTRTVEQEAPQSDKPVRDYSAELTALLSKSAAACLAGSQRNTKGAVSIQVVAQVMSSGAVNRADVQGAGLTPPVLTCIQKLASALQLLGPIEGAPRSVQAQLTLLAQGSPDAPQPKAADDNAEDERDENPRDSKLQDVHNDPAEVEQRDEPTREPPEPPEPREQQPADTRADQQP